MSTELEERLRQAMEHATADIQVPRGLAHRAARHRRRRIITGASAAAVTAAAVTAMAAVSGTTGASRDIGTAVTARLASNVEAAVAAVAGNDIVHLRAVAGTSEQWGYEGPREALARYETFSASGQPRDDFGLTRTPAGTTQISVDYAAKT